MPKRSTKLIVGALLLAASGTAIAFPWDTDMANSASYKAYERPMRGIPAGVVAQDNVLTPVGFSPNYDRMTAEGKALKNPTPANEATLAKGQKMFGIYCTPCHGDGVTLGPVGDPTAMRFPAVVQLAGKGGVAQARTDGQIYLTIRNGGVIMPHYGWAMNDEEMWSIVRYVRTLPNATQPKPAEEVVQ